MAILVALGFVLPSTAQAADVTLDNTGMLTYTASPGKVNNVTFVEAPTGTVTIERISEDTDAFGAVSGCATTSATVLTCVGVKRADIDAGDDNDRVTATDRDANDVVHGLTSVTTTIDGGEGADALDGGAVTDVINGGPGDDLINGYAGDDTLSGGDGNDTLTPNNGTDRVVGGDGIDTAVYGLRPSPTYSLDGLANDGGAGENDLIGADVENVEAAAETPSQTVTITGDGRANWLSVSGGRANLNGGEGADVLEGGAQDDTITSRDGSPDTVICNGGIDTVVADTLDAISPSCENVQRQASPGGPSMTTRRRWRGARRRPGRTSPPTARRPCRSMRPTTAASRACSSSTTTASSATTRRRRTRARISRAGRTSGATRWSRWRSTAPTRRRASCGRSPSGASTRAASR